jgi:hypothetical protein
LNLSSAITVPVTALAGWAAGAVLALVARRALARVTEPMKSRYFVVAGFFGFAALAPAGLALYLLYPDWSLMYLADPKHLSLAMMIPFLFVLYALTPPLGFLATLRLFAERRPGPRRAALGSWALVFLFVVGFGFDRLFTVAFYDSFHYDGPTLSLFGSALFLPLVLIGGAVVSVFAYALLHVRRHIELGEDLPALRAQAPANLPASLSSATRTS